MSAAEPYGCRVDAGTIAAFLRPDDTVSVAVKIIDGYGNLVTHVWEQNEQEIKG